MFTYNDVNDDSNILNIISNVDTKKPIYSTIMNPYYIDEKDEILDNKGNVNDTVLENKAANTNYNWYSHGYQILWRPLLLILEAKEIMNMSLVTYFIILLLFVTRIFKDKNNSLGLGLLLMNVFFIIPYGFNNIQIIPCLFICLICQILVYYVKDYDLLFMLSGISVAFFDFLTIETLVVSTMLLICLYKNKEKVKVLKYLQLAIEWVLSYSIVFLYKWSLVTVIYKENCFKKAIEKYGEHTSLGSRLYSIKANIGVLFNHYASFNTMFIVFVCILISLSIIVYLLRKQGSEKYVITIFFICLIPYIRYLVLYTHSYGCMIFTYRAQLVLIPSIVLLIKELDFGLLKRKR